jgi:hypothetical protein
MQEIKRIEELVDKRKELADLLNSVVEPNGSPYFSKDWIVENIIGIKDKSRERKKKIKKILKDE